jgi:hypothetical protein
MQGAKRAIQLTLAFALAAAVQLGAATLAHGYSIVRTWDVDTNVTYCFANWTTDIPNHDEVGVVQDAVQLWDDATAIDLQYLDDCDLFAVIRIGFFVGTGEHGDGMPFPASGGAYLHSWFPTLADIHFNDNATWTEGPWGPGPELCTYTLQAIGRALGLGDSSDPDAVMAVSVVWPPAWHCYLDADDIAGVQAAYGPE